MAALEREEQARGGPFSELADRVFGHVDALQGVDAVLVALFAAYVDSRPALGRADTVALNAIAYLSQHDPATARVLMDELGR